MHIKEELAARHTLAVMVDNEPGILARIAGLFTARGYNIESLTVSDVTQMTIWGNHSATQYPDVVHAKVGSANAWDTINDEPWVADTFIPTVQKRGAAIIEARGASSAASAANAAIDHIHDWVLGTPEGDWVSMGVAVDGQYGIDKGIICGMPTICKNGKWEIVEGLELDAFSKPRIDASVAELREEYDAVKELGLI